MADTMLMIARQARNDLRKGRPDQGQSRMATVRPGARPVAPQVGLASVSAQRLRRHGKSAVNSMAGAAAPIQLPRPPPWQPAAADNDDSHHQPLLIENCRPAAVSVGDAAPPLARDDLLAEATQDKLSLAPSQQQQLMMEQQLNCQQQLLPQPQLSLMSRPVAQSLATGGAASGVGGTSLQLCAVQLALYLARSADAHRPPLQQSQPPALAVRRFQFDTPSPDERVLSAMASIKQTPHQSLQHLTTSSSTRSVAASGPLL